MVSRLAPLFPLLALLALSAIGCDDGGGNDKFVGTWQRVKNFKIGANTRNDTWTLTFNNDGTYVFLHQRTESLESTPLAGVESRQGSYDILSNGNIELTGEWLDLTADITSLGDLDGNLYAFNQNTQFIFDESRGHLYIGPDFNEGSSYVAGDSYNILYNDGNAYNRNTNLLLTDIDGNVVEEQVEQYSFTITDDINCTGSFSSLITQGGNTNEDSGSFSACTYAYDPGEVVESIGGGTESVVAVRFEYTANGVDRIEYFIGVGDHFLGYPLGYQATALTQSAFVRVD